ncbi:GDSL-type esterase/lipase family protein [Gaetbulibacter sp. M235]|uniref:GDSL-type esterase/lipase family protein n=1 Tax=Gaetbulibacter sp. M235 TaxID=3126510 RepID=UPI00374FB6AF
MTRLILIPLLCAFISMDAQERIIINDDQQFIAFLENSLENGVANSEITQMFYQRTWDYWRKHMIDYNQNPEKYSKVLSLYYQNQQKYKRNDSIKIDRFENQIESFRRFDNRNTLAKNPVLFIGSSSIVFWETAKSFPDLPIINRGFGGASLQEIIHYYDDIVKRHSPSILVVYCDIDIERGKSPNVAFSAFKELVNKVRKDFPLTQIFLLSMKPTLVDDFIQKDVSINKVATNRMLSKYCDDERNLHYIDITNMMIKSDGRVRSDIFLTDGMHLNQLGYGLWDPIIRSKIMSLTK